MGLNPIAVGSRRKVILLEYILSDNEASKCMEQQKMVDLLISLCHSVLFAGDNCLKQFMPIAKNSATRLSIFEGTSLIWPGTAYLL